MIQSHHNLRSLSSALKSTEVSRDFGIHGPVLPTTHKSKERLAVAFGFKSEDAFTTWINSYAFMPFYTDMQRGLQKLNNGIKRPRQGPQLGLVQQAIEDGEQYGINKYSRRAGPEFEHFVELDYYAQALFYIVEYNSRERLGAFFGKNMTTQEMQARI